jgi:hypothetical protein
VIEQTTSERSRRKTHFLLGIGVDHVVDPAFRGFAGLPAADVRPSKALQLDRHMLQHMAGPGAFVQALHEASRMPTRTFVFRQAGYQADEPVNEARDDIAWPLLELADIDDEVHDRHSRPDIWPPKDVALPNLDHAVVPDE